MEIQLVETTAEYQDTLKGGWTKSPLCEENIGKKLSAIIPRCEIPKLFSAPDFFGNTEEEMISGMKSLVETGIFAGFVYKESRNSSGMNMPEWRELLAEVKVKCAPWK
jgi:hypothetical protein